MSPKPRKIRAYHCTTFNGVSTFPHILVDTSLSSNLYYSYLTCEYHNTTTDKTQYPFDVSLHDM